MSEMTIPLWYRFKAKFQCWFHYLFIPTSLMHLLMHIDRQRDTTLWFLHGYIEVELEKREGKEIDFQEFRED